MAHKVGISTEFVNILFSTQTFMGIDQGTQIRVSGTVFEKRLDYEERVAGYDDGLCTSESSNWTSHGVRFGPAVRDAVHRWVTDALNRSYPDSATTGPQII